MIELFFFCLLTSLAIQAIYISIHWEGMILNRMQWLVIDLPDWLGKPTFNCPICMASWWTFVFWALILPHNFSILLFAILIVAGMNAILSQLIELLRLLVKRLQEDELH